VEVEEEAEAEEARRPLEVDRRQVAATRKAGRTSEAGISTGRRGRLEFSAENVNVLVTKRKTAKVS
jgi:hypothetical protein